MSDIRTLDFNLLKAFVVLLDECNVSRAAQRLSITQPAMSGILNRLRESFNDPLFVRVQHGMQPTDRALQLGQTARNILQDISSMLQPPILEPEHLNMTLRIAAMDYVQQIIALPLILRLRRLAPNVKVALLPVQGQNIKTLFEQNKIDLALVSRQHLSTDTLKTVLYEERYVCAMSKTHPMAQTPLSLDQFCNLPFAMLSYNGGEFSGATDLALQKIGLQRKVMVSVNHISLLPQLLQGSDLVAVLPERLAKTLPNVYLQPPPIEVEGFTMMMAWHERTEQDTAHRWLREVLQGVVKPKQAL
ncbi:TPA: LysR family transcriptional regulator [Mannheimia haemolytica]|uniref:LysR family transcriptional regulator n=1 Tax=Mannheimia haemolytica TaxID=75985 RepID=UPI000385E482|nr:LysR family transcriptional regulator [Mannheimia haemolytica]EPZ00338.1 transcriptional regulator [Mannheimia haemolytica D35]KIX31958.1 transcriptional regulator [Mannheimia haemolytica]KYL06538.1 transcriptional regulator [Mannheimia haemolytica]MDW0617325.1 LysR family transcriptional regulator [Mannheimia haemolytica]MDW1150526.1 LysR family transcriptional regulator [Mannheimia haemolytica]